MITNNAIIQFTKPLSILKLTTGNDIDLLRTITGIPEGRTLYRAYFEIKANHHRVLIKHITIDPNADGVIIADASDGSGIGQVLFQLRPEETAHLVAGVIYHYTIEIRLDDTAFLDVIEEGSVIPMMTMTPTQQQAGFIQ